MNTGLFISRDDGLISAALDIDLLVQKYDHLAVTKVYNSFSSTEDQSAILKVIAQEKLDAVVLAGNSPSFYDRNEEAEQFVDAVCNQGVNKNKMVVSHIWEKFGFSSQDVSAIFNNRNYAALSSGLTRPCLIRLA